MAVSGILNEASRLLGSPIMGQRPVSGGDINQAWRLELADGRTVFMKSNSSPQAESMFRTEAGGLQALREPDALRIPEVLGHIKTAEGSALLLEYMLPGSRGQGYWAQLGAGLAAVHRITAEAFGWAEANFIGTLPQSNRWHDTWAEFYVQERLAPQYTMAREAGFFDRAEDALMEAMYRRVAEECPVEPAALIHGDLWSGNVMADEKGRPVLIDPAVCFGHREMDLAMSLLFGGFGAEFYQQYTDEWPLQPGWERRVGIYQLYYLLVHVNLFGAGYVGRVRSILRT